jgi:hypothetical protein
MHNAGVIALPTQQSIRLRPELWLALGVASYNHQLLTKEPLRVISPREIVAEELTAEKVAMLDQGLAALADASSLSPSALTAAMAISSKLLAPLGVTVSIIGNERTARFLLLEFVGGQFSRKSGEKVKAGRITADDPEKVKAGQITTDDPREALTAHSYPASSYEPGAEEQMRRENEAQAMGTTPESTGARRTG